MRSDDLLTEFTVALWVIALILALVAGAVFGLAVFGDDVLSLWEFDSGLGSEAGDGGGGERNG